LGFYNVAKQTLGFHNRIFRHQSFPPPQPPPGGYRGAYPRTMAVAVVHAALGPSYMVGTAPPSPPSPYKGRRPVDQTTDNTCSKEQQVNHLDPLCRTASCANRPRVDRTEHILYISGRWVRGAIGNISRHLFIIIYYLFSCYYYLFIYLFRSRLGAGPCANFSILRKQP